VLDNMTSFISNASAPVVVPLPVLQLVSDTQLIAFATVTAFSIMVYDVLLCMNAEIEYIWRNRLSLTKVLYILCRYLGLLNGLLSVLVRLNYQDDIRICNIWGWYNTMGLVLGAAIPCNAILTMRLYALYKNVKYMFIILIVLFATETLVYTLLLAGISGQFTSAIRVPAVLGCVSQPVSNRRIHVYSAILPSIPNLTLTFVYCAAAVYKVMQHLKERLVLRSLSSMRESKSIVSPLTFLLRDTVIFYLMTLAAAVLNLIIFSVYSQRFLGSIGLPWLVATYSMTGSRLVLMLKGDIGNQTSIYKAGSECRVEQPEVDSYDEPEKKPTNILGRLNRNARDSHIKYIGLSASSLRRDIQVV